MNILLFAFHRDTIALIPMKLFFTILFMFEAVIGYLELLKVNFKCDFIPSLP